MLERLSRKSSASLSRSSAARSTIQGRAPFLLRIRSSTWFIALAVSIGILVDLASYSLAVPVIPFRLEHLHYHRVGDKTGYLVAAYAGGQIASTPLVAYVGARWRNRQVPLVVGLCSMIVATVIFMEAKNFQLMVVARILQGFSGTTLWCIGLALLADSVPEDRIGSVLGVVLVGFPIGQAIGPPVGGALYDKFGYRAPFIFMLILVGLDLVLRLFIIEKHTALKYIRAGHCIPNFEAPGYVDTPASSSSLQDLNASASKSVVGLDDMALEDLRSVPLARAELDQGPTDLKSQFIGYWHMLQSPRAMTTILLTLVNGFVAGGMQDTGLTLYLQHRYHMSSSGAGLVFLGLVIPVFFASPPAGWLSDKYGTKWVMLGGVVLSIPMFPLLIIKVSLPVFIVLLSILGVAIASFVTPTTTDLALVAAGSTSIKTAQIFGVFNLAYSVGALIGPVVAGSILARLGVMHGWIALAGLSAGLTAMLVPPILIFVGGPLNWRRFDVDKVPTV